MSDFQFTVGVIAALGAMGMLIVGALGDRALQRDKERFKDQ